MKVAAAPARKDLGVRKYVIMGVQGSGKGTQATLLAARPRPRPPQRRRHLPLARPAPHQDRRPGAPHDGRRRAGRRRARRVGRAASAWPCTTGTTASSSTASRATLRQAEFFLESYDIDGVIHLELPDEEVARAGAGPAAVLGVRARLQPAGPPARRCPTSATSAAARSWRARTTTPRRWPRGCATTTPRRSPVIELFERKEFVVELDATKPRGGDPGRDLRRGSACRPPSVSDVPPGQPVLRLRCDTPSS